MRCSYLVKIDYLGASQCNEDVTMVYICLVIVERRKVLWRKFSDDKCCNLWSIYWWLNILASGHIFIENKLYRMCF